MNTIDAPPTRPSVTIASLPCASVASETRSTLDHAPHVAFVDITLSKTSVATSAPHTARGDERTDWEENEEMRGREEREKEKEEDEGGEKGGEKEGVGDDTARKG